MNTGPINVTKVDSRATARVHLDLDPSTTPDVAAQYSDRRLRADRFLAEYDLDQATGLWRCIHITLAGHRLLKPAADGTPRVGKDRLKATYGGWRRDLQSDSDLPEWLNKLVDELRPSGSVTLPGM